MKIKLYILILIGFISISYHGVAQAITEDTLAVVQLENSFRTSQSTLEFDLVLRKSSDTWRYYANSTFQLIFPVSDYDYKNIKVELLDGTSDLTLAAPGVAPYKMLAGTLEDRISVITIGPDKIEDAHVIPMGVAVKMGRFRISSIDGTPIPDYVSWKRPITYYQAAAFKYDINNPVPPYIVVVDYEDNVEMSNAGENFISYADDATVPPSMSIEFFKAAYMGNLQVDLWFKTFSEYQAQGFVIKRSVRLPVVGEDLENMPDDAFIVDVADWKVPPNDQMLTGQFTSRIGKEYGIIRDVIEYRGVEYIYRLYYQDAENNLVKLATRSLTIPNAVIEYAQASPNPFTSETRVKYYLRDNVYLTCVVFDRIGQLVAKLKDANTGEMLEGVEKTIGWHETVFSASDVTAQGSYDIVFIAYPLNDPGVELSRAIVKVQLLRDGK